MPTIDGCELTEDLVEELKSLIESASPDELLSYARSHPESVKGFQLKKSSASHICNYAMKRFPVQGEIPDDIKTFCAKTGFNSEFVTVMSERALKTYFTELLILFGRRRFLTGLILDEREEVRKLGLENRNRPDGFSEEAPGGDSPDIRSFLGPFVDCLMDVLPQTALGEAVQQVKEQEGELQRWKKKAADYQEQSKQERAKGREADKLRAKLAKIESKQSGKGGRTAPQDRQEMDELQRRLKQARELCETAEQTVEELRLNIARLNEQRDSAVNDQVESELSSFINSWLTGPRLMEQEADKVRDSGGDLLQQVETALQKQAAQDRHSGNRRVLSNYVCALREARDKVRTARAEALVPLAQLGKLEEELSGEIDNLKHLLGDSDSHYADMVTTMKSRINSASTTGQLDSARSLLVLLDELEVLRPPQLRKLYTCFHSRMSRLYGDFAPEAQDERPLKDPLWRLRQSVAGNRHMVLALDGHNILYRLPALFDCRPSDQEPGLHTAARDKLIQAVSDIFSKASRCEARIFFDGPQHSDTSHGKNIKVVYSGGTGRDRADRVILEYLEYCRRDEPDTRAIVVTDDRELRKEAEKLNAQTMSVQQFGALLED